MPRAGTALQDKDTVNQALLERGDHAYFSDYYYAHVHVQTYDVMLQLAAASFSALCAADASAGSSGEHIAAQWH